MACLAAVWAGLMFPLKLLGYNPLSCNNECRWLDVLEESRNFDVVLLSGTGIMDKDGKAVEAKYGNRLCISAGWVNSNFSNKSCGTSVVVGERFKSDRIHEPFQAKGKIAGRGIAVRISSRLADITAIAAYYPPVPIERAKLPLYRETCRLVTDWISQALLRTPGSSTPVLFADVNDGIGKKGVGTSLVDLGSSCVSSSAARRERIPGGAGELLRALLEAHDLVSISSWSDSRDTFFGNWSSSLLDHLFLPQPFLQAVRSAGPLAGMGKKLQLIRRKNVGPHSCACDRLLSSATYAQ